MATKDFLNKITCGDANVLIKQIDDKSIDLIIIDPPYNFIKKHKGNNFSTAGAYGDLGRAYYSELENNNLIKGIDNNFLAELVRVMKKVNIYIWCNKDQILDYLNFFKDYNMDILTWHKTNPMPNCQNKYLSDTEYLLFFRENGVKIHGTYETKKKFYITDTNKVDKDRFYHPTIKPLEIMTNIILNSSKKGAKVLDTYIGSGTTAVACINTDRQFIGFEIDKKWCKIANNRIHGLDATGQYSLVLF